jgi:hypothetical protein
MKSEQDLFDELKYNIEIDELGHKLYRNKEGELHRDEGPTYIGSNGYQVWYRNGKRHREDGPSIIGTYGTQYWYQNGQLHREDGPAAIHSDGRKEWSLHGILYTKEEWEDEIRTRHL